MNTADDIFATDRLFVCSECGDSKPLNGFYLQKQGRCRPFTKCKECNKRRVTAYISKVRQEAPEKLKAWRTSKAAVSASVKKYLAAHKQCNSEWWQARRVAKNLRSRTSRMIIKLGGTKSQSSLALLGCTIAEARAHLEAQFQPGMNWNNYGKHGWHIDHIRPCARFDLTDPEQQRQCFHYTNLQPLWAAENISKGARQ